MFIISENGKNRIDITLSGKLDAEQMRSLLDELTDHVAQIEEGLMLVDLIDFHLPSLGAIAIEITRLPELFALTKKFHRSAILTDKAWVRKVSEWESALLPELELRCYTREERTKAEVWLKHEVPIL